MEEQKDEDVDVLRDSLVPLFLSDPKAFQCVQCNKSMTIPALCENGHIACCYCCKKKCLFCSSRSVFKPCSAIERILESLKITCPNREEMISYFDQSEHDEAWNHAPHTCFLTGCNFVSSSEQLCLHLISKHSPSLYNFSFSSIRVRINLGPGNSVFIFREESENVCFALHQLEKSLGSSIWVNLVSPGYLPDMFKYTATVSGNYGDLTLTTVAKCISRGVDDFDLPAQFLVFPASFLCTPGMIELHLNINEVETDSDYYYSD